MRTALLALLALAAASGCRLDPGGRCDTRGDCAPGLDCLRGVCAACSGDLDCGGWQACGFDGLCEAVAGACDDDGDCASWEACGADHACALAAGHCADTANCGDPALECDPAHHCSLPAGACTAAAPDCPAWMAGCNSSAGVCLPGAAAGDDVLAFGTLVEGRCDRGAVSRATTSAASAGVELGFACGAASDRRAAVHPVTGAVVYRQAGGAAGDTLRVLRPDALAWDAPAALWRYPSDALEDDGLAVSPTKCPTTWDRWVMQGGTGEILYACPFPTGTERSYYDGAGTRRIASARELHAWGPAGHLLLTTSAGVLQVVPPVGAPYAVTGLPAGARHAWRTTASGFRVALHDDGTGQDALWEIDAATGAAALKAPSGTYAAVADAYAGQSWEALDADGNLYGRAYVSSREVVLRRSLSPAGTAEVYSEAATPAGANDFAAATFTPFLRLDGSFLFTTP